jgi:hypothetical protein
VLVAIGVTVAVGDAVAIGSSVFVGAGVSVGFAPQAESAALNAAALLNFKNSRRVNCVFIASSIFVLNFRLRLNSPRLLNRVRRGSQTFAVSQNLDGLTHRAGSHRAGS